MTLDEGPSLFSPWYTEGIQQETNFETKNCTVT